MAVKQTKDATAGFRNVHSPSRCRGQHCPFHNPSAHPLASAGMTIRANGIIERVCEHSVGHPDPDSVAYFARSNPSQDWSVHGCDGCCQRTPFTDELWGVQFVSIEELFEVYAASIDQSVFDAIDNPKLEQDIKKNGVLEPLIVRKMPPHILDGKARLKYATLNRPYYEKYLPVIYLGS